MTNLEYLKEKIEKTPEYYNNKSNYSLDTYLEDINPKVLQHLEKIQKVFFFNINDFAGAPNYESLLYDYQQDVKGVLDNYAKFLAYVYLNLVSYGVNLSSKNEINDIYNIKYNQMIQIDPSTQGYGINPYFNIN